MTTVLSVEKRPVDRLSDLNTQSSQKQAAVSPLKLSDTKTLPSLSPRQDKPAPPSKPKHLQINTRLAAYKPADKKPILLPKPTSDKPIPLPKPADKKPILFPKPTYDKH